MNTPITAEAVVAYSQCPRKAFLLLGANGHGVKHEYAIILNQQRQDHRTRYIEAVHAHDPNAPANVTSDAHRGAQHITSAILASGDLVAIADVLTRVSTGAKPEPTHYEPTIVGGTYSLTPELRTELSFVGYVLGQVQNQLLTGGRVVTLPNKTHKLDLAVDYKTIRAIVRTLRKWIAEPSLDPPRVVLNRHCPMCQFRSDCRDQAERADDLSLLDRMTPKAIARYHKRGIFTVTQLSYVFRLRKIRKHVAVRFLPHKVELQALALRTGKTYVRESPCLPRQPAEIFLDIEGKPDEQLYYLIGVRVREGQTLTHYAFWADGPADEETIFRQLLVAAEALPAAPIYHYGSYESLALDRMARKYGIDVSGLKSRLVNLTMQVHGKVYFPVRSNSIKEIGRFLGVSWNISEPSGLQSLVWRHRWETDRDAVHKEQLIAYNAADCRAVQVLVDELSQIEHTPKAGTRLNMVDQPELGLAVANQPLQDEFKTMLRSASLDYEHKKLVFRQHSPSSEGKRKRGGVVGHLGHGWHASVRTRGSSRVVQVAPRATCPKHVGEPLSVSEALAETRVIDLVSTKNGWRKVIVRYVGQQAYCRKCDHRYVPPQIAEYAPRLFGHGFQSWVMYLRLELRLPYRTLVRAVEEQFSEAISKGTVCGFLRDCSAYHAETERAILARMRTSPVIHVDETRINVQGTEQYVWVFTDGIHTIFRWTRTREATIVQEVVGAYEGVLASDFYAGYDALPYRQQKCLVHLIRDMNEDLWDAPFDRELEALARQLRDLLTPIFQAIDRYGLKQRHLHRFVRDVERFYRVAIDGRAYTSEVSRKYQKRFERYRESLFTFLGGDAIPWHNNRAERAIRCLAIQRKISGTFYESLTPDYLRMLGIAQTCRFQEKSLLQFLVSGGKDVDDFATVRRRRSLASGAHR